MSGRMKQSIKKVPLSWEMVGEEYQIDIGAPGDVVGLIIEETDRAAVAYALAVIEVDGRERDEWQKTVYLAHESDDDIPISLAFVATQESRGERYYLFAQPRVSMNGPVLR